MPAWIYGKKVPLACPKCNFINIFNDIPLLMRYINTVWSAANNTNHGAGQDLPGFSGRLQQAYGHVKQPTEKHLRDVLRKKGYVEMLCFKCWVDWSEQVYKAQGIDCIRIGDLIFSTKFYNENKATIEKQLFGDVKMEEA